MKTFKELVERWISSYKFPYSNAETKVYENPSKSEIKEIVYSTSAEYARMLLMPDGTAYAWSGSGIHAEVARKLKLDKKLYGKIITIIVIPEGTTIFYGIGLNNRWFDKSISKKIKEHKQIKRLFPSYTIKRET